MAKMRDILWFIAFIKTIIAQSNLDPAGMQLLEYRNMTEGIESILTNSAGHPIEYRYATSSLNTNLVTHPLFVDLIQHFDRERIPERVVHTKGGGGFGYFEVTDDVTDICEADFLSEVGKVTPVAVRFSLISSERGSADTVRDGRGFSVKFYTNEGNFDMVGLNIPIFPIKDPLLFPSLIRTQKYNPVTHLPDNIMTWDFISWRPEALYTFLLLFGDAGIPDGYTHMPGYSIHTYQVVNKLGVSYFVRFHLIPDAGFKYLTTEQGTKIAGSDPDYNNRELYNAIAEGKNPSWTMSLQVLSVDDVNNAEFDVFDATRELPLDKYPLRKIGKLVLNQNPKNYFADIEQLAYCPSNLVPGILGSPGKLFEGRVISYKDAQNYRLSPNYNNIPVNCPFRTKVNTYNRDSAPPVGKNGDGSPNYFPNSFNGPYPYFNKQSASLLNIVEDQPYNFDQANEFYNSLSEDARKRLLDNLVSSLIMTIPELQERVLNYLTIINHDLGYRVQQGLTNQTSTN